MRQHGAQDRTAHSLPQLPTGPQDGTGSHTGPQGHIILPRCHTGPQDGPQGHAWATASIHPSFHPTIMPYYDIILYYHSFHILILAYIDIIPYIHDILLSFHILLHHATNCYYYSYSIYIYTIIFLSDHPADRHSFLWYFVSLYETKLSICLFIGDFCRSFLQWETHSCIV